MVFCRRVAIIGAGPSGLVAIKTCKEEEFEPVCFERNGEPGGLWRYHDEDIEGVASVMKTTILNTGKEKSAFSDFPPPKESANFMHHSKMFEYLMQYAEHFDLLRHIRYYSEVIKVDPAENYDTSGRWTVSIRNSQTNEVTKDDFDGVMVCIGHHVYPKIPAFPGQETFQGTILHSHSVKSCDRFEGKRVVVVGIGNSGADVAVDCSFVAKNVYLSTRSGAWIFARMGINGRPYDMDFSSRRKMLLNSFRSFDSICNEMENNLNQNFDHEAYNLKPKFRVLNAHPTMNDFLPSCVLSGRIAVKSNIEKFKENGVVFDGEGKVTEVDVVILATGYIIKFPFLDNIVDTEDNKVHLYKYCIPPNLKHASLGIIGLCQPVGSIFTVAEMQCRWFIQLLSGKIKLPSTRDMEKDIKFKNDANSKRYIKSSRHTIQVDWIPFMDELAKQIGAKPNLIKLAITDPKLFLACFNGPCLPYQYRLQGPHSWSGARNALLTYEERVFAPLNSNGRHIPKSYNAVSKRKTLIVFLISITGIFYAYKYLIFSRLGYYTIFNIILSYIL